MVSRNNGKVVSVDYRTLVNENGDVFSSKNGRVLSQYNRWGDMSWNGNHFAPPPAGAVLYMPGLPGAGSTITDFSGSGNNGTITEATWAQFPGGLWYLSFDGNNDTIDCGSDNSLNFTSGAFTIECWIKTGAIGSVIRMLYSRSVLGESGYDLYMRGNAPLGTPNELRLTTRQGAAAVQLTASAEGTIVDNTTYHLAVTRSGATVKLYINGSEASYRAQGTHINPATCAANAYIGKDTLSGTSCFKGDIGLERIYNTALSAVVIAGHYNQERHLFGV